MNSFKNTSTSSLFVVSPIMYSNLPVSEKSPPKTVIDFPLSGSLMLIRFCLDCQTFPLLAHRLHVVSSIHMTVVYFSITSAMSSMNFNRLCFLSKTILLPHMCWFGREYPMPSLLYNLWRVMTPIFFLRFSGILYSISYIRYFRPKWDHFVNVFVWVKKSLRAGPITLGGRPNLNLASISWT